MRILFGTVALACTAGPVAAADWDHDANIDAAVVEVVATYRLSGALGMERLVAGCYELVSQQTDVDARLKQLEYCAGMDVAGYHLDRLETVIASDGPADFFRRDPLVARLGQVSDYVNDAVVTQQIIQAWSRSAAEALARKGF